MILPPKRFQAPENPRYDSIRHLPWFAKLPLRRNQIKFLAGAYKDMLDSNRTQKEAAMAWNVDERELRDYINFIEQIEPWKTPNDRTFQVILDEAYQTYCDTNGRVSIRSAIQSSAKLYGENPRHVIERWEIDPAFYPTNCHY